ncbi:MAG TPA: ketoacyl-ACP synthase III [Chitinophagales bacterium]|nr:ketoacyl-ACP synthase III [Chitinophagales bacterium]
MALFSIQNIRVSGISSCVPKTEVSNFDLELISPRERDLLVKSVGIEKRRVAEPGICTSDLCLKSAETLLSALGWRKEEIGVLIFVTQTPDYITPATSNILQDKLGLPGGCLALDINLGCSGYVYGIAVAASLLAALGRGKALLLAGDISTATVSEKDKSTAPIFSDAGSATALEIAPGSPPLFFNLQGNGKGFEAIMIPDGGYRHPVTEKSLQYQTAGEGIVRNKTHLILNGIDVFNFSVTEVPKNVEELLKFCGKDRTIVDYYLFHQANLLINESIRKKLKLESRQVPYSLRDYGNTSSATIPVTIVSRLREQVSTQPLRMIFSGFGVGLSWGSMYVETDGIVCTDMVCY